MATMKEALAELEEASPRDPADTLEDWREKLKRNWINMRMGHEAAVLDKITKEQKIVRDTVRHLQKEAGIETTDEEDDVGVNIGNEIHYHQESAAPAAPSLPAPTPPNGDPPKTSKVSKLAPWLLAASIPAAGAAGYYLKPDPAVDTDTQIDVTASGGIERK